MLAQLCTPTYEMWSEVFPTGPEETLSRLRSLVGRTWIDPKTIRHFPVRRIIFFFLFSFSFFPQNNQSKRKRRIGTYTDRKNRERVIFISFSLFVLCTKRRDRLTNITYWQISLHRRVSCVHLFSFFYFFFFPSIVSVSQEIGCFRIIKQRKICMRCAKATFERITRFYSRVSCILVFFQEKFDCLRLFTRILSKYILFDIICTTKRTKLKVWGDFGTIVSFFSIRKCEDTKLYDDLWGSEEFRDSK